ncbi:helix-turn-helix domain-containing protein [Paradevosia shaoguanensis]|uniref:helix-turn-helix domain-containing protein n=1 Tax=Paradevosia shaoguanensis TaxID=1335043 RepID=UPI003C72F8C3
MAKRYELPAAPKSEAFFKEWRESRGWTQQELADRLETTVAMVSRIEGGERDWGKGYLEAFSYVIGCHVWEPLAGPPGRAIRPASPRLAELMALAFGMNDGQIDQLIERLHPQSAEPHREPPVAAQAAQTTKAKSK